jgi:hypothetical protein
MNKSIKNFDVFDRLIIFKNIFGVLLKHKNNFHAHIHGPIENKNFHVRFTSRSPRSRKNRRNAVYFDHSSLSFALLSAHDIVNLVN